MPLFQLRYSPPSLLEPETVLARDAIDAIDQCKQRLAARGGDRAILLLDGAVLHTFAETDPPVLSAPRPIDMDQLFASAGIYVFRTP